MVTHYAAGRLIFGIERGRCVNCGCMQGAAMRMRWVGVALMRAEETFGTIGDAELLRRLSEALEKFAEQSVAAVAPRERHHMSVAA